MRFCCTTCNRAEFLNTIMKTKKEQCMKKSNTAIIITEFFIYILYLFFRRVLSDVYDTYDSQIDNVKSDTRPKIGSLPEYICV
jgi:hypothetical protein